MGVGVYTRGLLAHATASTGQVAAASLLRLGLVPKVPQPKSDLPVRKSPQLLAPEPAAQVSGLSLIS